MVALSVVQWAVLSAVQLVDPMVDLSVAQLVDLSVAQLVDLSAVQ